MSVAQSLSLCFLIATAYSRTQSDTPTPAPTLEATSVAVGTTSAAPASAITGAVTRAGEPCGALDYRRFDSAGEALSELLAHSDEVERLKGVGRVYQQTFIDTYSKVAFAKLYTEKTAITSADLLNDQVVPFFDRYEIPLCRVLTDRGTEYCGKPEHHPYELYLAVEDIEHTRTKVKSPQTNGICERFHKTILNEFYRVTFRKRLYDNLEQLQADLDVWLVEYNEQRSHQGRWCYGKTPLETFLTSLKVAIEKNMAA